MAYILDGQHNIWCKLKAWLCLFHNETNYRSTICISLLHYDMASVIYLIIKVLKTLFLLRNSVTTMWLYKDNCTKSNILTWCKIKIVLNFHFKGVWLLKRHAQKLTLSSVTLTIFLRVKFLPFVYSRVIYWTLKNMKQSFNVQFFLAHEREFFQWVAGIHVNYLFQA